LVIDAYVKIVDEKLIKDIGLVLIGTFDDATTKSKMVEAYSRYNIKFIEFVPEAELSLFYSNTVCFLYMSLFEGFGLPVLEAMQCGAPVICSNAKSIPEVLGDSGICINPDSIDTLCEHILKVLDDQEIRTQLSNKGVLRSKMFSWDKHASRVVDIYKNLK
jgi:glycosyltransferase involved in cell wall biosynthesis